MNSPDTLNTSWRKVASTIYKKPVDSKIFGEVELDVTDLEKFIFEKRKQGIKITPTHIFVLIIARGLKTVVPELNVYIRRGRVVARPSIDALVSVLQADGGMGSVTVQEADTLNLEQLAEILKDSILESRMGDEKGTMKKKNILASLPWPFRNWFFSLYKFFTLNLGLTLPFFKISAQGFGSFVLTNIGSIGLDTGYPALLPSSNVAFVFVLGGIMKKPIVINDEIVIRRMMSVSVVIDHRIADASHGGKMLRFIKQVIRNPDQLS